LFFEAIIEHQTLQLEAFQLQIYLMAMICPSRCRAV